MADQPDWLLAFIDIKDTSTAPLGQTGEETAPADPEEPCPATTEGSHPLKMTWRELLTDFICACIKYENPFPFVSPIVPAPVIVAAADDEQPSNRSSAVVDTPSDSGSPSDTATSSNSAIDAPSGSSSSSSSASAVGDNDIVTAAPCGAPTVIATAALEPTTDADTAAPTPDNADATPAAANAEPTWKPTPRGKRSGKAVKAREAKRAAKLKEAQEAAGRQA